MVDVLCGVMSGGRFKERIRKWSSSEESSLGTPSESQEYIVTRKVCILCCDLSFLCSPIYCTKLEVPFQPTYSNRAVML